MVRALAAATVGGMTSLPQVFAGGVVIGLVEAVVRWNWPTGGPLELVLFVMILASLLFRRGLGQMVRGGEGSTWSLAGALQPLDPMLDRLARVRRARAAGLAIVVVLGFVLPLPMSNAHRVLLSSTIIQNDVAM